jgi:hypothetical protein
MAENMRLGGVIIRGGMLITMGIVLWDIPMMKYIPAMIMGLLVFFAGCIVGPDD